MASTGPVFRGGYCNIPGWREKTYRLDESTWKLKTSKPEREHLIHNFDMVLRACADPDVVRESTQSKDSLLLYKVGESIRIRENVEVPFKGYLVVVVRGERRIQTI